jgi:hypothetical protein
VPAEPTVWAFQRQVEVSLYANYQTSGAMYRLLHRSGVGHRALSLKKSCIAEGLVTQSEFDWLHEHLGGGARSFTLVPLDALQTAIETYGRDERSEALIEALGLERPASWGEEEEDEEGEEGDGEEGDGEEGDGEELG